MRRELLFQRALFFVLVVCLGVSLPVVGQRITGDIAGERDRQYRCGSAECHGDGGKHRHESVALGRNQRDGDFRIPELPIGTYRVTASAEGFKSAVQTAEVQAGAVIQASFKLTVGQRTETVEVEGTAPLVELSPNNNNYVDSEKIENVPLNGRDFNSLLAITPGVQRTPGGGFLAISINGSKVESNNYFIDGLYNNDRYYGDSAIDQTGIVGIPAVLFPPGGHRGIERSGDALRRIRGQGRRAHSAQHEERHQHLARSERPGSITAASEMRTTTSPITILLLPVRRMKTTRSTTTSSMPPLAAPSSRTRPSCSSSTRDSDTNRWPSSAGQCSHAA